VDEPRPVSEIASDHTLRAVARAAPRQVITAPPIERVDVVAELDALSRKIVEHNRRVMAGEPADWSQLADQLADLTQSCRRQVTMPDIRDIGDSGSH
jgi:hypothetical protein